VAYELDGRRLDALPAALREANAVQPVYEELPGWREDVSDVRHLGDLPRAARRFVQRIEQLVDAPVDMISVGPEREQAIVTRDIFGGPL
jgi:adenylosuccinate synthase